MYGTPRLQAESPKLLENREQHFQYVSGADVGQPKIASGDHELDRAFSTHLLPSTIHRENHTIADLREGLRDRWREGRGEREREKGRERERGRERQTERGDKQRQRERQTETERERERPHKLCCEHHWANRLTSQCRSAINRDEPQRMQP